MVEKICKKSISPFWSFNVEMLKYHPIYVFKHMINKVNSQKKIHIFAQKDEQVTNLRHGIPLNNICQLNERVFGPFWTICTFSVAEYEHRIYSNFTPAAGVLFSPGAQWHMAFPHSAQWHIRRKSGKKLHSLAHSCSNYISHCQFFSQPRWVFGKKVKFSEKELFIMLKAGNIM